MSKHFKVHILSLAFCSLLFHSPLWAKIDRHAVVTRNNPWVTSMDSLQSLSVGNGGFAMTVDGTGLQTFPEYYSHGVPLGTMSDWGWHTFANPDDLRAEEALVAKDFGRGHLEYYAAQFKTKGRQHDASEWYRKNAHRLHLGTVGLNLADIQQVRQIRESLDMWNGVIHSSFYYGGNKYEVQTVCSPDADRIASVVRSTVKPSVRLRFPYPTGGHSDDACDWKANDKHTTTIVARYDHAVVLQHQLDATVYYVIVSWKGKADLQKKAEHVFVLQSRANELEFSVEYRQNLPDKFTIHLADFKSTSQASAHYWQGYWKSGGIVDFSHVKDNRAKELERRVVLSQYLLAVNDAGTTPPQETGLTYNSWFGKFHLEMTWWHLAQFALWGHSELLDRPLSWYQKVAPVARDIAKRQGFDGIRWMKMTDPSGAEAPSNVGSYLIWQQPHLIYLAELLYRAHPSQLLLDKYGELIDQTADFMYSFATYDQTNDRYILKGCIPAQETLKAEVTYNPPFELSYWHYAIQVAQKWRERRGLPRKEKWDVLVEKLSPLAANADSLYLAAESAVETYQDIRCTSDHMAVLGALGILPDNKLVDKNIMRHTFDWVIKNWNWNKTWGWDFPMTAMCATRLGDPEAAVNALLLPQRTNTYLVSGHNYQDDRLRVYLPGNGGLLTTVALMCAGWDGNQRKNPGFPKEWDVRWEGLLPMP